MKLSILVISLLFLAACSAQRSSSPSEESISVFWVNSAKVDCMGVGPMTCLHVQRGETMEEDRWELFYNAIQGFEFEPGYRYKLLVQADTLPKDQVPADASSIRYTLLEELEKKVDSRLRLHDIWALTRLNGEEIHSSLAGMERPRLELQVAPMRAMGTDGCNHFNGAIETLTDSELAFGPLASTRKMCRDMTVVNAFNRSLSEVRQYQLTGLELVLMNDASEELLRFRKVD